MNRGPGAELPPHVVEQIRKAVEQAPPLSRAQRDRLAVLLTKKAT